MKRLFIFLLGIILFCGLVVLSANLLVTLSTSDYILQAEDFRDMDADCIIVLGAKVAGDTLSSVLKARMDAALLIYESGAAKKLLLSGDHGQVSYDEVNAMRQYAEDHGVDREDIFLDHAGFSTYETMYRARDIFQAKKVIIVTQDFHMPRALYIARSLGLQAYGFESEDFAYANLFVNKVREVFARTKDVFTCILQPGPTYLGDAIPISGTGIITHDKG
ncbi:MAG: SanA/YdcF family protein [Christensenellales bacterium]